MGLSIAVCVRVGTALGASDTVQAKRSAMSGVLCTGGWSPLLWEWELGKQKVKDLGQGKSWHFGGRVGLGSGQIYLPNLLYLPSGPEQPLLMS